MMDTLEEVQQQNMPLSAPQQQQQQPENTTTDPLLLSQPEDNNSTLVSLSSSSAASSSMLLSSESINETSQNHQAAKDTAADENATACVSTPSLSPPSASPEAPPAGSNDTTDLLKEAPSKEATAVGEQGVQSMDTDSQDIETTSASHSPQTAPVIPNNEGSKAQGASTVTAASPKEAPKNALSTPEGSQPMDTGTKEIEPTSAGPNDDDSKKQGVADHVKDPPASLDAEIVSHKAPHEAVARGTELGGSQPMNTDNDKIKPASSSQSTGTAPALPKANSEKQDANDIQTSDGLVPGGSKSSTTDTHAGEEEVMILSKKTRVPTLPPPPPSTADRNSGSGINNMSLQHPTGVASAAAAVTNAADVAAALLESASKFSPHPPSVGNNGSTVAAATKVAAAAPNLKPPPPASAPEVIDLLDDDEEEEQLQQQKPHGMDMEKNTGVLPDVHQNKRQKVANGAPVANGNLIQPGQSLGNAAAMNYKASTTSYGSPPRSAGTSTVVGSASPSLTNMYHMDKPQYITLPDGFIPTWEAFVPWTPKPAAAAPTAAYLNRPTTGIGNVAATAGTTTAVAPMMIPRRDQRRYFQLSLLNVNEFTITGLPISYDSPPTPVIGLRAPIRQISREHGKAVYDKDADPEIDPDTGVTTSAGGKWRIPLGAYQAFYAYLRSDKYTQVDGIPQHQLQIASLARERQAKGFPAVEALIKRGVPTRLAKALAPFQRGGVDFVLDKNGRALIADDMGLGKTIQGIASMSVYHNEWPLLVLCPSSARYHWEAEFQHWLGPKSHETNDATADADMAGSGANSKESQSSGEMVPPANDVSGQEGSDKDSSDKKVATDNTQKEPNKKASSPTEELILNHSQIHVLTSSKDAIMPNKDTKVVICSYGLVPLLIKSQAIVPGQFAACIVDESHMLKNKNTKRTSALVPVLTRTKRCVLLSGTPALARPAELWPQLVILGTQQYGWWEDEADFMDKYVKRSSARRRAELHTMLSGTIMIRRLKNDILKTLPKKRREKATLHVINSEEQLDEFKGLLKMLRKGKGAMGKLARKQHAEDRRSTDQEESYQSQSESNIAALGPTTATSSDTARRRDDAVMALQAEIHQRFTDGRASVQEQITQYSVTFGEEKGRQLLTQLEHQLRTSLEGVYQQQMAQINAKFGEEQAAQQETERTAVLSRLYMLSGQVKIPLVVDMLNRWLDDKTKGKICIFAHHISVLDEIEKRAKLSNAAESSRKFIRIDGSTSPKERQKQISTFQNDASVRVALLGITAAGVAVTLTACSTVWFAELFWTPAIMIQAEDRCHRIGQQARVKCLYLVAKGTIDDVLWKLIEKKFQDLGEFVEGKEKLKMVVDHTYANAKELFSMFQTPVLEDEDKVELDDDDDLKKLLEDTGSSLDQDIEALGLEERQMLRAADADDEEGDQTSPSNKSGDQKTETLIIDDDDDDDADAAGRTEEAAITLSDDEDDAKPPAKETATTTAAAAAPAPAVAAADVPDQKQIASRQSERITKMFFRGPHLGLEIAWFYGRVVIAKVHGDHRARPYSKPSTGDVLVSVNGHPLPMVPSLEPAKEQIRAALQYPPVLLAFAEDPILKDLFSRKYARKEHGMEDEAKEDGSDKNSEEVDVIDLLDDSEDEG